MSVDMPLEQLLQYKGTNPKPADFDDFWDRSVREMESVDPCVQLVPASYQLPFAECLDLYFTGVGGSRIHAKVVRPRDPAARTGAATLLFHGYSASAGDWYDKLPYAAAGFTLVAMDCRGQAGTSEDLTSVRGTTFSGHLIRGLDDKPEKMLIRSLFLDAAELVHIVANLPGIDRTRIGVWGGSQGGGLTVAAAALVPWVKCAVPKFPFLSDYRRVWNMNLAQDAYGELKAYFRQFDPFHEREEEIFQKLGYIDVHHLAPRIRADFVMHTGLSDTVCPPSTQFAVYNAVPSRKKYVLYPDFGHESFPLYLDNVLRYMTETLA